MRRYTFRFDGHFAPLLRVVGVTPSTAWVEVDDVALRVYFGRWRLISPTGNVAATAVTGPFAWPKVIGPHLSLTDRGVTFGTNADVGLCAQLRRPVPGLARHGWLRHPAVTVTVDDPAGLAADLHPPGGGG